MSHHNRGLRRRMRLPKEPSPNLRAIDKALLIETWATRKPTSSSQASNSPSSPSIITLKPSNITSSNQTTWSNPCNPCSTCTTASTSTSNPFSPSTQLQILCTPRRTCSARITDWFRRQGAPRGPRTSSDPTSWHSRAIG